MLGQIFFKLINGCLSVNISDTTINGESKSRWFQYYVHDKSACVQGLLFLLEHHEE